MVGIGEKGRQGQRENRREGVAGGATEGARRKWRGEGRVKEREWWGGVR